MISIIKGFISWLFYFRVRSGFKSLRVGESSRILFWRIRPYGVNDLIVGKQSFIETKVVFERAGAKFSVGDRTFIGAGTITVANNVQIGNDVMLAWGVSVSDHNSHSLKFSNRKNDVINWLNGDKSWTDVVCKSVKICDKAWIGFNSIILKGVTVGEGAVVGAGSVVSKDIPPWTIVAGNPARIIRELPENER